MVIIHSNMGWDNINICNNHNIQTIQCSKTIIPNTIKLIIKWDNTIVTNKPKTCKIQMDNIIILNLREIFLIIILINNNSNNNKSIRFNSKLNKQKQLLKILINKQKISMLLYLKNNRNHLKKIRKYRKKKNKKTLKWCKKKKRIMRKKLRKNRKKKNKKLK